MKNIKMNQFQKIDYQLLNARIIVAFLFLTPAIILLFTYPQANNISKNDKEVAVEKRNPFSDISVLAKSVYIWDVEGQRELYSKNKNEQLPLASVSKVMTALVALENMPITTHIKITDESIKQEGDSGLANDEKWRLKDLIDFSLITSSNDGIYAVASAIESQKSNSSSTEIKIEIENQSTAEEQARKNFIDLMNKKAKDISLNQTFYLNETGLDFSDNESGGYGSAEDMAKLFAYLIKNKPEILEATAYDEIELKSLDDINHLAQNTNEIVGAIPNLIASKTGYTDISGGNLVIAFDSSMMRPIVISVLGSTREGRFEDMEKLIEATMEYLADEGSGN